MIKRLLQFVIIAIFAGLGSISANAADVVVFYEDAVSDYKDAMQEFVDNLDSKFKQRCDYLGYTEYAEDNASLSKFAYKLCVAVGTRPANVAMTNLPSDVPIAYCMVYSPESINLLEGDLNFGVALKVDPHKQMKFIKEIIPSAKSVATFVHSQEGVENNKDLQFVYDSGFDLDLIEVPEDVKNSDRPDYVNNMIRENSDVIWTYPDSHTFNMITIKLTLLGGIKNSIPVYGYSEKVVKAGALFGVAVVPESQGSDLAVLVNDYLSGRKLENRHNYAVFEPAFNVSVAEKLKIKIPDELLDSTRYVYGDVNKYKKKVGR